MFRMQNLLAMCLLTTSLGLTRGDDKPDFAKATREPYSPEGGKSINGKEISEYKAKVEKLWPDIVFEKDGKKVEYVAKVETDFGNMEIEFFTDAAPNHARSFICLAKAGYFDGLKFHRCLKDFMIQGGCPLGTGTGGPGYCLKPEFNSKDHVRGVLSAARAQPEDSAGSQFFLCHGNPSFLNGKYTAFGKVTKGMEVVDKIVDQEMGPGGDGAMSAPIKPIYMKKVTIVVKGEN